MAPTNQTPIRRCSDIRTFGPRRRLIGAGESAAEGDRVDVALLRHRRLAAHAAHGGERVEGILHGEGRRGPVALLTRQVR